MLRLGLGKPARRRRGMNIAAMKGCELWLDAARTDTHHYADGLQLARLNDLSGRNRHLTKTGAGNETVYPVYNPAERGVQFLHNAYDQMIAGAIGDWNFLHDGTGCTVMMLVKVDAAHTGNAVMLSTSSEVSGGVGTNIWYYDANQQYHISTRAGAAQVYAHAAPNGSLPKNSDTILSVHMALRAGLPADLVTRSNGRTDLKLGNASAFSSADSTGPLYIGKLAVGVAKCRFLLKKCVIFSRRISKAEENLILEDWARSENISLTRYGDMPLTILAGQSNAKGRGLISETDFAETPLVPDAFIFNNATQSWNPLQAGVTNAAFSNATLGMEMTLAKSCTERTGKPFYLVKYAADGIPITSWETSNSNFINLQTAMQRAYWNLEDSGYAVKPCFIWYQGENDALDLALANAYEQNLKAFLDNILAPPEFAQSPGFIVQIHQSPPATGTAIVRDAQLRVCMTSPYSAYCRHIEIDDIAEHSDQHHVTASTLQQLAQRIIERHPHW